MAKAGLISFTGTVPVSPCVACVKAKMTRSSHPARSNSIRASHPCQIIHSDICGPIQQRGTNGAKFFATFIVDYSRFIAIFTMRHKSETLQCLIDFVNSIETELGSGTVKTLISDNGGEYISDDFKSFCRSKGIQHLTSCP